ncbi:MAG: hypothetical protein ACR2FI_10795 [Burkholderiales bacterium]|nr:hypothetical protein [Burkholderiales bacterium]MDQ3253110.1 hypothetical protein [Acidobacteriota bacterium]
MDEPVNDSLKEILARREPPCLSLYQPTHRTYPENRQDAIRYGNLLKKIEESLQQHHAARDMAPLLKRFRALADDVDFWNYTLDGLAVLGARDFFKIFRLQRPVPELAIVADSFHAKPLLRILQSAERYQMLAVTQDEIKLYQGTRDALDEVDLADGVPRTLTDALGEELTDPRLTASSYGMGSGGPSASRGEPGMYHGHGGKKDEVDIDRERFFRAVDRPILEHHSRPSGLPLILAALTEHHAAFHKVSHNPFLMADGIRINPDAVTLDELRARAWRVVEPEYHARLARLVEEFGSARAHDLGSDDLAAAAKAAATGKVAKLLVEAGRQIAGRFDRATGDIARDRLADPEVDDLLDDLAETTLAMGGEVVVVPPDKMPTTTGVAAIYRY